MNTLFLIVCLLQLIDEESELAAEIKPIPRCALQPRASPQIVAAYPSSVAPLISLCPSLAC